MTFMILLALLIAAVWWVCASPLRLIAAAAAALHMHPVPALVATTAVVTGLIMLAVLIVRSSLADSGGLLMTISRTAPGGVAA